MACDPKWQPESAGLLEQQYSKGVLDTSTHSLKPSKKKHVHCDQTGQTGGGRQLHLPFQCPLEVIVSLGWPVPSAWSSSVWEQGAKCCYQLDQLGGRGGLWEGQTTQTTTTLLITCHREDGIAPNHVLRVQAICWNGKLLAARQGRETELPQFMSGERGGNSVESEWPPLCCLSTTFHVVSQEIV